MSSTIINPTTNTNFANENSDPPNPKPTNESLNSNTKPSNESLNSKTKTKEKEAIPNSLIIYIKTRIPNFYKLNYEPFMTVPQSKSHTVYFDPLVKYYTWPVRDVPNIAPKDAIFSQFFEAAEFDTMINRILSDFRYMQKPRTLQQAFNEGIIDNNINITLNTLFKPNNLFYLNKTPYTIVNQRWSSGAWDIDKKPIHKLLNQFSHLSAKQLEEQAKKEEDEIPESLRQGNLASQSLAKKAAASYVATGLADAAVKPTNKPLSSAKGKTFLSPTKVKSNLEYAAPYIEKLFSKYLQDNPPINYSKTASLLSDPLTLSLLIDPEQISKFISDNPENSIVDIYDRFWTAKDQLFNTDNDFKETIIELNKIQASVSASFDIFKDNLKDRNLPKYDKQTVIKNIFKSKFDLMTCFFKLADLMNSIYQLQKIYFESLKSLLEEFKKQYATIINYPGNPELAIKCIDFDIETISVFLNEDHEDKYSRAYFKNFEQFTKFYKNLNKNKQQLLNPQFNYAVEIKQYTENPLLIKIELDQFELYGFRILLYYSYNQLDIWVYMFKASQTFSKFIQIEASRLVEAANQYFIDYQTFLDKNDSDQKYRLDFLKRLQVDGVKFEKNKWQLVKSDGSKCNITTLQDLKQEELYIGLLKNKVECYDVIILYIYILEITCLRQHSLYVAEENINHLNYEHSGTLENYYNRIDNSFKDGSISYIPDSLFDYSKDLSTFNILKTKSTINKKLNLLYLQRLKSIPESREFLNKACEEIHDAIDPSIDTNKFLNFCNSIINFNIPIIPPYTFRSSYWLEIDVINYDLINTQDFLYNMSSVIKKLSRDFILREKYIDSNNYLDWMVLKNTESGEEDTLLASVCNALNGQLNIDGNDSINKYTEKIKSNSKFTVGQHVEVQDKKQNIWLNAKITKVNKDETYDITYTDGKKDKIKKDKIRNPFDPNNENVGKNRFTISSLKRLIEENKSLFPENTKHITILQSVLKIKFIVFEMFPRENPEIIKEGDIVNYNKDQRSISCRVLNIRVIDGNTMYDLIDNDSTYDNIPASQIELSKTNLTNFFRINCSPISNSEDLFIYLVITQNEQKLKKYELVINTSHNKYIYGVKDIPMYIIYFLYNNCNKFLENGYQQLDFKLIEDKIANIQKDTELKRIEEEIQENLYDLHNRSLKSELDHDEELQKQLLNENIEELEEQRKQLIPKDKYQKISLNSSKDESKSESAVESRAESVLEGGAYPIPIKPSELYADYANPLPTRYNTQQYMNYPQNNYIRNTYPQNNYPLYDDPNAYPPPIIPDYYAPPGFRRPYRYSPYHYNQAYQLASNKARDTKSKLAFYIEIELELYPGKTASIFQKSVVRCQSIFERIREAYSDIMGYQYRPGAMTEAYAYQYQNQNKYNKKRSNMYNKTLKNNR